MTQSILITGCSSGIGLCAAKTLKKRGFRVFATARKAKDVAALKAQNFESLQLDLDDPTSIEQALSEILTRTDGRLDVLFNNSGYAQPGALSDIDRETLRAQFETNVFGTFDLTKRVVTVMRRQGHGRIIMNTSILGLVSMSYRGAYNASKYALEALTDTLRLELKQTSIHVSMIEPGPINTAIRKNAFESYSQHIDTHASDYKKIYDEILHGYFHNPRKLAFSKEPDAVVKKLIHAIESDSPKIRYKVGMPSNVLSFLKRILPDKTMDKILYRISHSAN